MTTLRRVALFAVLLAVGCKKAPPPQVETPPTAETADSPKADVPGLLKKLRAQSPSAQRDAAEALGRLAGTDPAVIPGLLDALNDPTNRGPGNVSAFDPNSTREAAVMALIAAGSLGKTTLREKGVPMLIAALKDGKPAVREHAAVSLGRAGPTAKTAVDALWPVTADPGESVRTAALDALREIGPPSAGPAAKLLSHESEAVRKQVALALRDLGPVRADAVPDLVKALSDPDVEVRAAAADALASLGSEASAAVSDLIGLLKKTTDAEIEAGDPNALAPLRALVGVGEPAVAALTLLLSDASPGVRLQAVFALGQIGPSASPATEALTKLLRDPVGAVAVVAAVAVARVSGDGSAASDLIRRAVGDMEPAVRATGVVTVIRMGSAGHGLSALVVPLLDDPDAGVRKLAIEFAGSLEPDRAKNAVPLLAKRLESDTSDEARRRAAEVLGDLGPASAPAAAALGKAAGGDGNSQVRLAAVAALATLGLDGKAGLPGLAAAASDPKEEAEVRAVALAALPRIGDPTAADAVLKAAADKAADIRIGAAAALARFDPVPETVIIKLAEMAKGDPSGPVRAAALRAVAELGPAAAAAKPVAEAAAKGTGPDALWAKVAVARIDGKSGNALPAVRDGLSGRSTGERLVAATALPLVQPTAEDVTALGRLLKDRSPVLRRLAAESAGRCGPAAKPLAGKLAELLRDSDGAVRVEAAAALGKIGDGGGTVANALRDAVRTDPRVARAAQASLKQLGLQ